MTVEPAYGHTASNSGDTYVATPERCITTSCWIGGLPRRVTVPPRGRVEIPFTVRVPDGTGPGDYLAGVVVRPTVVPPAPSVRVPRRRSG